MGVYTEKYKGFNGTHHWTGQLTYRQAGWRHWVGRVLHAVTVSRPWMVLEDIVEPVAQWWHVCRCNDDCVTGRVTRSQEGSPNRVKRVERYCGRTPFGSAVDIWCYHFSQRGRVLLSTEETPWAG